MKFFLILILSLICNTFTNLNAQKLNWAFSFTNSTNTIIPKQITTDFDNNILVIGNLFGSFDFDLSPNNFILNESLDGHCFIAKFDSNYNFIRARGFGKSIGTNSPTLIDFKVDNSNNYIIGGNFKNTIDFNTGGGSFVLIADSLDPFILKVDINGSFIWCKKFTGLSADKLNALTIDKENSIISVGTFLNSIDMDPNNGLYQLNSTYPLINIPVYVNKLDSNGNFLWANNYEGNGSSDIIAITSDNANNIYIGGSFKNNFNFDPGFSNTNLTSNHADTFDLFFCKVFQSGNFG
jgi:hypothetical protein